MVPDTTRAARSPSAPASIPRVLQTAVISAFPVHSFRTSASFRSLNIVRSVDDLSEYVVTSWKHTENYRLYSGGLRPIVFGTDPNAIAAFTYVLTIRNEGENAAGSESVPNENDAESRRVKKMIRLCFRRNDFL